jgi:hypothetical protein
MGLGLVSFHSRKWTASEEQGPRPCLLAAGGDDELGVMEERLVALVQVHQAQFPAAVRVALELVDRILQRCGGIGALALHDHQRDAVD